MSWIKDIKKELKKVDRILFDPIIGRYARINKDFLLKLEDKKRPPQKILTEREKERIEREKILERAWDRLETTFDGINKISDDNERTTLIEIARNYNYRKHSLNFYLDWQGRVLSLQLMDVKHLAPESLSCFSHLMDLSISRSNIQDMKWLKPLIKLRELSLNGNNIQKIEGLKNLKHLKELKLFRNQIRKIEGLENLHNLKELDLRKNCLTEIKGLENLTNLQYLNLHNNEITEIKGLDNLRDLKSLYLDNNKITEIKGLDNLENILRLDLSNNNITEIKGLGNLITLFHLNLSGNKITEFKGIDELVNLYSVIVTDNPITKIHPIKDVPRLNYIAVFYPKKFSPRDIIEVNRQLEVEGLELCYGEGGSYLAISPKLASEDISE